MKSKRFVGLSLGTSIVIAALSSSVIHAKQIYPAEVMGRDLDYWDLDG